jgi:hypothetical protein
MTDLLAILLRIAGAGLLLLAVLHIPIGRQLGWKEDCKRLTPTNEAVFHVHTFFICLTVVMMALPCLLDPAIFLVPSRAGAWISWSFAAFWGCRLYFQWFVYPAALWRGKRLETRVHILFTVIWLALTAVFAACGAVQAGWLA